MYGPREYVEQFHLLFLDQLGRKIDKKGYALKGGCNLRFFFKSPRYSEDMDLDVARSVSKEVLQGRVDGILGSRPFREIIEARGLQLTRVSAPKQTATTQRWKLMLSAAELEVPLPTKVEFSRRGMGSGVEFARIDPDLVRAYRLSPMMANHYSLEAACRQKFSALLSRRETQARDVFDLDLLVNAGVDRRRLRKELKPRLDEIQERLMSVPFEVFKSQVLAFLPPEHQSQYDSPDTWDRMVLEIVEGLEEEGR
jgi:predicted nucleotidyltransferase component of viral defense system